MKSWQSFWIGVIVGLTSMGIALMEVYNRWISGWLGI